MIILIAPIERERCKEINKKQKDVTEISQKRSDT